MQGGRARCRRRLTPPPGASVPVTPSGGISLRPGFLGTALHPRRHERNGGGGHASSKEAAEERLIYSKVQDGRWRQRAQP